MSVIKLCCFIIFLFGVAKSQDNTDLKDSKFNKDGGIFKIVDKSGWRDLNDPWAGEDLDEFAPFPAPTFEEHFHRLFKEIFLQPLLLFITFTIFCPGVYLIFTRAGFLNYWIQPREDIHILVNEKVMNKNSILNKAPQHEPLALRQSNHKCNGIQEAFGVSGDATSKMFPDSFPSLTKSALGCEFEPLNTSDTVLNNFPDYNATIQPNENDGSGIEDAFILPVQENGSLTRRIVDDSTIGSHELLSESDEKTIAGQQQQNSQDPSQLPDQHQHLVNDNVVEGDIARFEIVNLEAVNGNALNVDPGEGNNIGDVGSENDVGDSGRRDAVENSEVQFLNVWKV